MNFYSFTMLGKYGRLGNQMFQVSAIFNLARTKNAEILLPNNELTTVRKYFNIPCIDIGESNEDLIRHRWEEKKFSYDENFYDLPSSIDLLGYFQSWKYIKDEKSTREIFRFSNETIEKSKKILNNKNAVSMHIRRTDYLKFPDTHPTLSLYYYEKALKKVLEHDNKAEPIIFTDDVSWCESNFKGYPIISQTEDIDMCAMSMCKYHIIANSSFSWWAAWLGKSTEQIVIAPVNWFGPKGPQDVQDLLPLNYVRI